jgi:phosphatidylglycerol:prolipoprotein diacylglycerol transferase
MLINHHWVDQLDPFLLRMPGGFGLRYYGLAYILSFLIGYYLLTRLRRQGRSPLTAPQEGDAVFALVLGVMVGGRVGYMLLYGWAQLLHHPLSLFEVWKGGMSSHGGFIGVALACAWIARRCQIKFLQLSDTLAILVPPGLLLVRVANFINGELWGKVATVPWAVVFPNSAPAGTPWALIPPRHPSQIYEAALEGIFLLAYTQWRFRKTPALNTPGRLSGEFLILYALVRILCEQFREPDAALIFGVSRGIFYSLFLILAGTALGWHSRQKTP